MVFKCKISIQLLTGGPISPSSPASPFSPWVTRKKIVHSSSNKGRTRTTRTRTINGLAI